MTVTVTFLANTFTDMARQGQPRQRGRALHASTAPPRRRCSISRTARSSTPFNGATVSKQSLNTKKYIDITFVSPTGAVIDQASIDGNEIKLTGAGASNLDKNPSGFLIGSIQRLSPTTYRFFVQPKAGVAADQLWVAGEVTVQIVAGSFTAGNGAVYERRHDRDLHGLEHA